MGTENINRIDLRVQSDLTTNQYCLLDYLLFRSNLDNWGFRLSNIVKETALTQGTAQRTLRELVALGWAGQDAETHYVFFRRAFLEWMSRRVDEYIERSKLGRVVPKWNGKRSKLEGTNKEVQIGITNKSTAYTNSPLAVPSGPANTPEQAKRLEVEIESLKRLAAKHQWPQKFLNHSIDELIKNFGR